MVPLGSYVRVFYIVLVFLLIFPENTSLVIVGASEAVTIDDVAIPAVKVYQCICHDGVHVAVPSLFVSSSKYLEIFFGDGPFAELEKVDGRILLSREVSRLLIIVTCQYFLFGIFYCMNTDRFTIP